MKILEFADIIGKNIIITYHSNQDCRFSARFEDSETKKNKNDGILCSDYGNGKTPEEAIKNYMKKISGKRLVFNAFTIERTEYNVPKWQAN